MECFKTQELYFELEMAKWNVGNNNSKIPESVCSKPCPMGKIKNFEVRKAGKLWEKIKLDIFLFCVNINLDFDFQTQCCWTCVPCREDSIVAREDLCLKCPHGEWWYSCGYIQHTTDSWTSSLVLRKKHCQCSVCWVISDLYCPLVSWGISNRICIKHNKTK